MLCKGGGPIGSSYMTVVEHDENKRPACGKCQG